MLEVVQSQVSLLDERTATSRPQTLIGFDRVVSVLVLLHITPANECFAAPGMGTHVVLLTGV